MSLRGKSVCRGFSDACRRACDQNQFFVHCGCLAPFVQMKSFPILYIAGRGSHQNLRG
jgi:hypothetical protein